MQKIRLGDRSAKSRGGTRWVLDFRNLISVSASKDTRSEEESSSSPTKRTRIKVQSPCPGMRNPPSTSQRTRPWSALELRLLGLVSNRHQGSPAPPCFASESGPPNHSNQGREPPTPLSPTTIPVHLTSFAKNTDRSNRKRKWAYYNHIETNMQT